MPSPVADYRFDDSHASSVPGAPPIEDIGTGNSFATETVRGAGPNRVLRFPAHDGLYLPTAGLGVGTSESQEYSVVMDVRLDSVSGYRRLLNWHDPAGPESTDDGLYVHDGKIDMFSVDQRDRENGTWQLTPNTYVQIAVTRDYVTCDCGAANVYVDGVKQDTWARDSWSRLTSEGLRFFKDDGTFEETGGAVARIRFYNRTLSGNDVAALAAEADPPPDSDFDGVPDAADNCPRKSNPRQVDSDRDGRGDRCDRDDDNDGVPDSAPSEAGSARLDKDSDDDGLSDGREVHKTHTNPRRFDTDGDGISDGVELGVTKPVADPPGAVLGTNLAKFRKDLDPKTRTNPLKKDTDGDHRWDGAEDQNHNGRRDKHETDPLKPD